MFYRLGLAAVALAPLDHRLLVAVVLAALPFAPRAAEALSPGGFASPDMESQQAMTALEQGLHTSFTSVLVIFSSTTMTADDPRFQAEATAAVAKLQSWNEVTRIVPFTVAPAQVSKDRHAAYTAVFIRSDADHAPQVLPAFRARLTTPPNLAMTVGGGPVFYSDIQSVSEADLRRAELLAFPFALLALLLVFRSVIAAGLPAAVGGCSVVVSLALLYLLASATPVSIFALNITTLFGLGLGVDYSLFMVSRFREELAQGREDYRRGGPHDGHRRAFGLLLWPRRLDWPAGAGDSAAERAALRWHRRHADRRAGDSGGGDAAARAVEPAGRASERAAGAAAVAARARGER